MALRVAFIAAECEPWAKTGGLGDVVDALARALRDVQTAGRPAIEAPVDVYLPRYRGVRVPEASLARPPTTLAVPDPLAAGLTTDVDVIDVEADGYRLRLVDHPPAFDRPGFYGEDADYPDNPWRFGLFCRTALEAIRTERRRVDVIHAHDWHACPAILQRDRWYADDPVLARSTTVLSLHNLAYHGWTPREAIPLLGLRPGDGIVPAGADGLDLLKAGITRADLANTVSPGYAREALTPEFGFGLEGVLAAKGDRFLGILNGIDTELWDPARDAALAAPFSREDRSGMAACRRDLLERVGFDPADDGPVLGMIGRLDPQKGFDLLATAAPGLLELGARLVVLGAGDRRITAALRELADARPAAVALLERFDREMARRIYAGADLFVMPSRFEPCGQGQMIALRYGTPPIVHATGGLRDTVVDVTAAPDAGTGFVFDRPTPDDLTDACARAIDAFSSGGTAWEALLDRGMAVDFDWSNGPAPAYVEAYGRAMAVRASATARR
jgi:starch synthase